MNSFVFVRFHVNIKIDMIFFRYCCIKMKLSCLRKKRSKVTFSALNECRTDCCWKLYININQLSFIGLKNRFRLCHINDNNTIFRLHWTCSGFLFAEDCQEERRWNFCYYCPSCLSPKIKAMRQKEEMKMTCSPAKFIQCEQRGRFLFCCSFFCRRWEK